jgi:hypothetical protein
LGLLNFLDPNFTVQHMEQKICSFLQAKY